jgi:prolyl oligopeptidase PreP (S9A serine peptidase family)
LPRQRSTNPSVTRTYLYGYGGFDISLTPAFSPSIIAWMERGGVFAQANLRGGGEYGKAWHDAGRLKNKQNVFDDFIAAAEYLTAAGYTSSPRLAIGGGSNGGLLVGACLTQRPDLFGAAVPAVGVLDMLRFHKFTIGWAWTSDYGNPDDPEDRAVLLKYSPLHNIHPGTAYPATLVITADHDDRVAPAHSHKFTATLQDAQAGPAPILARIDVKAGHGAGKPTAKIIEEKADVWAFLERVLELPRAPIEDWGLGIGEWIAKPQSWRSDTNGSTREARRAGNALAKTATNSGTPVISAKVHGSVAPTPNSRCSTVPVRANAPRSPTTAPNAATETA